MNNYPKLIPSLGCQGVLFRGLGALEDSEGGTRMYSSWSRLAQRVPGTITWDTSPTHVVIQNIETLHSTSLLLRTSWDWAQIIWVVVKIRVPFWIITLNSRCRIIIGTRKGTIILTTTHRYLGPSRFTFIRFRDFRVQGFTKK